MSTAVKEARRYAAMMDVTYRRKPDNRETLEKEIRKLEREFAATSKLDQPSRWFDLQDRLGIAYRKLVVLTVSKRRR